MFVFHTSDYYYCHHYNIIADQRLHGRYHSPLSRALAQFTGALGQVVVGGDQNDNNSDDDYHYHHGVGDDNGVHRRAWTGWCRAGGDQDDNSDADADRDDHDYLGVGDVQDNDDYLCR